MTVTKITRKIILDFSDKKITKNYIQQILRNTEFHYFDPTDRKILLISSIKIGTYKIDLIFDSNKRDNGYKLRNYGKFVCQISNCYKNSILTSYIDIKNDKRFNNVLLNRTYARSYISDVKINTLIKLILHCKRLDNLNSFL